MAVGRKALVCYEDDDVLWEFTYKDTTGVVTTIAGSQIELQVKKTSTSIGDPLKGPVVCTITSPTNPMKFLASFKVDLEFDTYNVSARRMNVGGSRQLVDAALTVLPSGSKRRS